MVYTPFARKYRPANFSELIGQEVLVKTLSYCIQNNRLAPAHLITGIRGVGKTSSARIIAKNVNCTNLQITDQQVKSCDECKNCVSFNNHNHPDIIEIDAASRTSVDDIREIIESVEYRPLIGAKKIFIIDEIHMLSKSAFNALLKVVEEPPEHIIFIFATTEVQKIPLTVVSRCQRYDLRRLSFEEISSILQKIATTENLNCEEEAIKIIANKSEGSARDAVSILDQAASYLHNIDNSDIITAELVSKMLGMLRTNIIILFSQQIIANDPNEAMKLLAQIHRDASNLQYFVQTMADFMAELCKSKTINNYYNPVYQNYSTEISTILTGTPLSRLTILWQIFSNGVQEMKQSHNELITAEMLLIKAIYACNLPSVENIIDGPHINLTTDSTKEEKHFDEIFSFLKYCHQQKEMQIYYYLLNEVEITEFNGQQLILKSNNAKSTITVKTIEKLLKEWSNNDWQISVAQDNKISTLKDKMLEQVSQSHDYQVIKNYFPDANISDIILNNTNN